MSTKQVLYKFRTHLIVKLERKILGGNNEQSIFGRHTISY